jgi:glucose/arabinose dehydrogenase
MVFQLMKKALLIACILSPCHANSASQEKTPEFGNPIVGNPPQQVEDIFLPGPEDYIINSWVENLESPWSLVFLPDGRALVSEQPGRIRVIRAGQLREKPYKVFEKLEPISEGGLLGLAKHPDFPDPPYLYAMYTYQEGEDLYSRVERLRDKGETAIFDRVIAEKIPAYRIHNGGRIQFGPDGMLYISTGDISQPNIAQALDSLAGKILRYTPDGDIPADNPFANSPIYSLGHRNPQGLAWHPQTGDLFSSEHGPSGEFGLQAKDVINVVEKGGNYGWPLVLGAANVKPYRDPLIMWPQTTPPSGMAFWNGKLYVATLRSEALMRITLQANNNGYEVQAIERLFANPSGGGTYGRLRDAVVGPDNALYVLTDNRGGMSRVRLGDDKILRLVPRN